MIALIWMCKQVLLSQYCWIKTCLTTFPTSWTNTFNQVRWLCLVLSYSTNMPPEKGTSARTNNRHTSSRHIFKFLFFMSRKVSGGWRGKCFADNSFPSCDLKDCKGYATSWTFPNVFSWSFLWSSNLFDRSIFAKSSKATQILCMPSHERLGVVLRIMLLDACLAAANASSTYSTKAATVSCHGYVSAQLLMLLFVASLKQSVHPYFSR